MAGRFPLLTDACVNDHLVEALIQTGWDVVRAIDLYPEKTKDEVLSSPAPHRCARRDIPAAAASALA